MFEVELLEGRLGVGDVFPVKEAGHTWQVKILAAAVDEKRTVLECDMPLGWDMQFASACVDTDAAMNEQFTYVDA